MSENEQTPVTPDESPAQSQEPADTEAAGVEAEAGAKPELPAPEVSIQELGPTRRKVSLVAGAETVRAHREAKYKEIASKAQVPGFRPGRAPRRLLVKRFGEGVDDEIKRELIVAGFEKAVEEKGLSVVGQPDMNIEDLELPEEGPLEFAFELEVKPDFALPAYKGIPTSRQETTVTDEQVAEQLERLRKRVAYDRHSFQPVSDGVAEGDLVTVDVVGTLAADGRQFYEEQDRAMLVGPGMLLFHPTRDEAAALTGAVAGETRTVQGHVGRRHEEVEIRGQEAAFAMTVKSVKRIELPEVDDEFAKAVGVENVDDLMAAIRNSAEQARAEQAREDHREEVRQWLLDHTVLELPSEMTERQKADSLARRKIRLLRQGVPEQVIQEKEAELTEQVDKQVVRDLKLHFIIGRIAEAEQIEVGEEQVNGIISAIAAQRGRRFARLREEMEQDGALELLAADVLERCVLDRLVELADMTAAAPEAVDGDQKAESGRDPV
jgi:trigger factor